MEFEPIRVRPLNAEAFRELAERPRHPIENINTEMNGGRREIGLHDKRLLKHYRYRTT
jgi:hypothetical protein